MFYCFYYFKMVPFHLPLGKERENAVTAKVGLDRCQIPVIQMLLVFLFGLSCLLILHACVARAVMLLCRGIALSFCPRWAVLSIHVQQPFTLAPHLLQCGAARVLDRCYWPQYRGCSSGLRTTDWPPYLVEENAQKRVIALNGQKRR